MTVTDLAPFRLTSISCRLGQWIVERLSIFCILAAGAAYAAEPLEFTRMVAHWADYADPDYLLIHRRYQA
jgi:hypothetical protein